MEPQSQQLLVDAFHSAAGTAQRVAASYRKLKALFPVTTEAIDGFDEQRQEQIDAFLKRFEQLQDALDGRVFRGVLAAEGEDVRAMSKRDSANLLEKLGAIPSAEDWMTITVLRNRLAHDYPNDPEKQADRMNSAFAASIRLLVVLRQLRRHVETKRLADLSQVAPVPADLPAQS